MIFLYRAGILFYSLFIHLYSLFNEKARLFISGRKHWEKKLMEKTEPGAKYIWFHCASLGEFEQGRPVIEAIKEQFPVYKIVLTFFSPSGYEIRKNYQLADIVCYLPIDTPRNVKRFLSIVHPEKVFFVKYEYWYFYISELKKRNIPLYIISSIFRPEQQFFKNTFWGSWYRSLLFKVEHFFVQSEKSGELLKTIGISNFTVAGDTRFDRVAAIANNAREIPVVEKFRGNSLLIIAGSTWKPDEELLSAFINQSDLKFIIAPHEVSEANINRIHQLLKKPAVSFSKVTESEIGGFDVLIIDSVGLLSSLYRYGNIAYIGGGFGVGIHNILEAATFGLPVIFGPNYKKFKEATDLVSEGGAFTVSGYSDLRETLNRLVNDEIELKKSSGICKKYVTKNVGSTQVIIKKVFNM